MTDDIRRPSESKRSQPIDGVLFDLDHTLVDYEQTGEALLPDAFERAGVEPFCTYAEFEAIVEGVPYGRDLAHEAYWTDVFRRAAECHGGDPGCAPALYEAYGEAFERTRVRFRPGAAAALAAARGRARVGLVTNGSREIQETKLVRLGIEDAFETVVYAGEAVPAKPAPDPFRAALDDLSIAPEGALHVGNALRIDVAGAKSAGLRAAWCPRDGERRAVPDPTPRTGTCGIDPDLVLDSLGELVGLLR